MKVAVLYSGGIDSLVMDRFLSVTVPDVRARFLFFNMGQPNAAREQEYLPEYVEVRRLDWLKPGEALFEREGSSAGPIVIPGRNLALASLAACITLPDEVWLGSLAGETTSRNVDKNWEFSILAGQAISYAVSDAVPGGVKVRLPLAQALMNKREAVGWALDNGVSAERLANTFSCVNPLNQTLLHCGRCTSCLRRWCVFEYYGIPHDDDYIVEPLKTPENKARAVAAVTGTSDWRLERINEILPVIHRMAGTKNPLEVKLWIQSL